MEYLNDLVKFSLKLDRQLMRDLLVALSVMVPHFSSELLEVILGEKLAGQAWPIFNETLAAINQVAIAVQVNGRLRAVINVSKDIDEISAVALAKDATKKWLTTEPTKTIFVKNKMVSFIFKDLVVKESTYREPTVEAKTDTLPLSKGSLFIQSILANHGLTTRVVELSSSTRTAVDAASSIGCSVSQIAKSLIFKTLETNKPVLVLASGSNLVDEKIIELAIGEKIIKADANFTRDVTGFAIGGIPPVGHKSLITNIFIDEDLLKYEILWAAAGTPNSVFSLSPKNLIELTKGTILKIN
jgi:prolyl-tRNA editing enzyme YbaK/EbsC (Cys-tRNA(Pro) deacylase)